MSRDFLTKTHHVNPSKWAYKRFVIPFYSYRAHPAYLCTQRETELKNLSEERYLFKRNVNSKKWTIFRICLCNCWYCCNRGVLCQFGGVFSGLGYRGKRSALFLVISAIAATTVGDAQRSANDIKITQFLGKDGETPNSLTEKRD